jgi:hypothetical protein
VNPHRRGMRCALVAVLLTSCGARSELGDPPFCPPIFARGRLFGTIDERAVYLDGNDVVSTNGHDRRVHVKLGDERVTLVALGGRQVVWLDERCVLRRVGIDGGPVSEITRFFCGWEMDNPSFLVANETDVALSVSSGFRGTLAVWGFPMDGGRNWFNEIESGWIALDRDSTLYSFRADETLFRSRIDGTDAYRSEWRTASCGRRSNRSLSTARRCTCATLFGMAPRSTFASAPSTSRAANETSRSSAPRAKLSSLRSALRCSPSKTPLRECRCENIAQIGPPASSHFAPPVRRDLSSPLPQPCSSRTATASAPSRVTDATTP